MQNCNNTDLEIAPGVPSEFYVVEETKLEVGIKINIRLVVTMVILAIV
jgi:hypothetical protein